MTTVTIGSYPTRIPVTEKSAEELPEGKELPSAEKAEAPAPAQDREEDSPEPEGSEGVRVYSPSASAGRKLRFRAIPAVQLLLAAGAGLFVWLGGTLGSAELRAAIAEAVERALHG